MIRIQYIGTHTNRCYCNTIINQQGNFDGTVHPIGGIGRRLQLEIMVRKTRNTGEFGEGSQDRPSLGDRITPRNTVRDIRE